LSLIGSEFERMKIAFTMKEKEILGFEAMRKEIQEWRSKYEFLSVESEDCKAKYIALVINRNMSKDRNIGDAIKNFILI